MKLGCSVLVIALLVLAPGRAAEGSSNTINAVLGDVSWIAAFGQTPPPHADETARIRTHLTYVLAQLRTRTVAHLTVGQRDLRRTALDSLERYITRGVFPRRLDDVYSGRRPRFIDDLGTHCAVAHLIADSGAPELAATIGAAHEYAYVAELTSPGLIAWAAATGFTIDELAMIQPSYGPPANEGNTRRLLNYAIDHITLECTRKHKAVKRLSIHVRGDDTGRAIVSTKSTEPFARCFVKLAGEVETGTNLSLRGKPELYAFDQDLEIRTPQELLERKFDEGFRSASCVPRPGPIPHTATFTVSADQRGVAVRVETAPPNADVAACFKTQITRTFTSFGGFNASPWTLTSKQQRPITSSIESSIRTTVKSQAPGYATDCYRAGSTPARLKVSVTARVDDTTFAIELDSTDKAFASCLRNKLQPDLRQTVSVMRELPNGSEELYFRIDADIQITESFDVESPTARDKKRKDRKEVK